jgi:hypothetical protein
MEYKLTFSDGSSAFLSHSTLTQEELDERKYAFPEQRKFPLPDRGHVLSAIKFFNYVDPKDEKHLANAILKRTRELGMSEVNVGETNRFKKYYEPSEEDHLAHHGVKGMKWGVRNEETKAKYKLTGEERKAINKAAASAALQGAVFGGGAALAITAGSGGAAAFSVPLSAIASATASAARTKVSLSRRYQRAGQQRLDQMLSHRG